MAPPIIRKYEITDEVQVVDCWHRCNLVTAWNDPVGDIAAKLAFQPDLFFVAESNGKVVGTVMVGYEGHRGWINYLGVLPEWQHHGVGRQLMATAETVLRELGCPKINLQVRSHNTKVLGFYEQLGFKPDDVVCLGKRLI